MELGDPLHVRMTKWGDRPHWEFDALWLGTDDLGAWVGTPAGTHHHRPGFAFDSDVDTVTLFPREGWWAATFHAPGIWCTTYVDMTTPAVVEPGPDGVQVRCVDLDLDVIRRSTEHGGGWYVDDEDEFAEHQVAYGYPPEVVAAAEASRDEVWAAAHAGTGAFDGRAQAWLRRLVALGTAVDIQLESFGRLRHHGGRPGPPGPRGSTHHRSPVTTSRPAPGPGDREVRGDLRYTKMKRGP